eukprot:gnl/TRDRNA2_/TRDRNA2_166063_c1_seq1.p1 gnl/TRDRNA2_/TRDRNA2_166063_c1~~gnl/TRDRNA2_/TRDRNA2_166063_c1_seq1.p1  ORF type:complete len:576 (-),score=118.15 gnl/TRDRNA2_/TRDRNA2_166063_c1_seq1:238-1965(-)
MHKYRLISKKGEGTFSEVLKAQSIKSGKYVAIKCMKNHFDSIEQVNNLREIQALRRLAGHPNIIKLHEVLFDEPTGRLALVFELMDMNLYEAIKGRRHYLPEQKVRQYMFGLLSALDHMHRNGIFHRDVKPENVLLQNDDEIKLADLGSCRGIYSRQPYTEYISTRWYRAPECLLTDGYYNFKMDLFAAGCVWFEIVALFPLFPGQNETDQIQKIHNVLGTPSPELLARKFKRNASHMDFNFPEKRGSGIERLIPHASPELVDLMKKLIRYDPDERILARQALKDPYFRDIRDAEKERVAASQVASAPPSSNNASTSRGAGLREPAAATKVGMSSSSSAASIVETDTPEVTQVTHAASRSETPQEERSGGLPNIRQDRRKDGVPGAGVGHASGGGGAAAASNHRAPADNQSTSLNVSSDVDEEGMVLPPIGGIKGKRDSKPKARGTFKTAANATLQKASTTFQGGPLQSSGMGVLGTSKGFAGTHGSVPEPAPSLSSTGAMSGAMSSTYGQGWGGAAGVKDPGRTSFVGGVASSGQGAAAPDKMNSTWAPSQQSRKYVSPFSHKTARDPSTGKKR